MKEHEISNSKILSARTVLLFLLIIIILAASLRLYGLGRQSLWYDEVVEEVAFRRLIFNINPDNTPPLNSFFVHMIRKMFPYNDFAIRIVPFAFGVTSVPLFFMLGRRLFNERVGLTASFLLAISSFHIWYSQDARMYALQWMLSLISLIYFVRILERPNTWNYIGYIISTVLSLYTHQLTVLLIVLQFLYVLIFIRTYKSQLLKWGCAFSAVVILYLPWIIYSLLSSMRSLAGFPKKIDFMVILYTLFSYCAGFSIGPSLREFHLNQSLTVLRPYIPEIVSLIAIYGTLFLLGLWYVRKDRPRLLLLLLLLTVPIGGVLILDVIIMNVSYNVRYAGIALFAFLLIIAKGVDWLTCLKPRISGKILAIIAIVVMTGFSAYSYTNYQFNIKYHKADFRSAAAYINEKRMPNDAVICLIDSGVINRYARGSFQCEYFHVNTLNDKLKLDIVMRQIVEGRKQLWLVLSNEWYIDNIGNVKDWFDNNYEEIKYLHKNEHEFANINIYTYDLTKKKPLQ